MNKEFIRMQILAGIITEGQYKEKTKKLNIVEAGSTSGDQRHRDAEDDYNRRQAMTPKDNWEGKEDEYIKHLVGISSVEWKDVDGKRELVPITGFAYADDHFADYDDKTSYGYGHAVGRKYLDWMLMVRKRYEELKKSGKIKDPDKSEVERKDREYWTSYYDNNPQFRRPEGY